MNSWSNQMTLTTTVPAQATGVLCVFYNMWNQVSFGLVFVASVF